MAQFERPDTDLAAGAWTYSTGATLYGCVDEASFDDADYIQLNNSAGSTCQLRLSDVTDPNASIGHIVRVRAKKTGTGTISCTAYLYQGASQKATFAVTLGTGYATTEYTLTAAEADAITDYTDLRLHLTGVCNASGRYVQVSWAELEVPNATQNVSETVTQARSAGVTAGSQTSERDGATAARTDALTAIESWVVQETLYGA